MFVGQILHPESKGREPRSVKYMHVSTWYSYVLVYLVRKKTKTQHLAKPTEFIAGTV